MIYICDNINVERKAKSVIKYVVNNLMSTWLTGQKEGGHILASSAWVTV